jgi:21S rRNA (uridine2791-2'-O)-methyltransferase
MLARVVARLPAASRATARCEQLKLRQPFGLAFQTTPLYPSQRTLGQATARTASSASSTRWKARQSSDSYARDAKVAGLKSRAAFKLLEINQKYKIFKSGDTVVDLGYAPGSWSQVAFNRTQPGGRVVGIDIIPAQPPKGVSTLQGDFLSPEIREEVRKYVQDPMRGRARQQRAQLSRVDGDEEGGLTEEELEEEGRGLVEREKDAIDDAFTREAAKQTDGLTQQELDVAEGRVVDVVLSDMSEPWPQTSSSWIRSVSNPWFRMMNTSGMAFRDHAGSMVCHLTNTPNAR